VIARLAAFCCNISFSLDSSRNEKTSASDFTFRFCLFGCGGKTEGGKAIGTTYKNARAEQVWQGNDYAPCKTRRRFL